MKVDDVYIAGIGTCTPGFIQTEEAVKRGWYSAEARDRSEILSVSVAGTTPAPDLAVEAARAALDGWAGAPAEIGALFHTNVHPQGPEGWSAQHYINKNTINRPVMSVEIRNGCVGLFSAMQVAACYLTVPGHSPAVLLTCGDNAGTPSVDRWHMSKAFIGADGGGAVVLSRDRGFARLLGIGSYSNPEMEQRHRGGEPLFPPGITTGKPVDFEGRFEYNQRKFEEGVLPALTDFSPVVVEAVKRTLSDADTSLGDITRVIHDGFNRRSINGFLKPLGIDASLGIWDFTRRHGHAGTVDQVRGLEHLWTNREVDVGDRVLMVSSAPGVEAACAVLEITDRPGPTG